MDAEKKPGMKPGIAQPKKRRSSHAQLNRTDPIRIDYFKDIVSTLRDPLLVLDKELRVLAANRSFYRLFKVKAGETIGARIYDLGNRQWDIPALRDLLETILPQKALFKDYEVEHDFPSIGKRSLLLNARRLSASPKAGQWILLAFEDISERRQAQETIRDLARFPSENPNPVLRIDRVGKLLYANEAAFVQLAGWKLAAGKSAPRVLKDQIEEVFGTGKAKTVEISCGERVFAITIEPTPTQKDVALYGLDITERRQAEQALLESEERFRSLFKNMMNGFAYCKMFYYGEHPQDFIYIEVNKAFETLTGLENVTGKRVSEVIPGLRVTDPGLFEIFGRVALTGIPETFEIFVEALKMWFSISVYSPRKEYFVAVFDVITERKQMENRLRESEIKYRELFMQMENGAATHAIICDVHGNAIDYITLDVNDAYESFLNVKREAVVGKKASEILPPEELQKWVGIFGPVALTGIPTRYELYSPLNQRYFEGSVYCMERGKFAVTFSDITERKLAQEQLIASEARYRRLFEAARDGILILEAGSGIVTDVNPFLVEMLGATKEEIIGKELWELGFFKDIASNKANFLELQQKGYIRYEDLPLETHGGRKFQVEFVSNVYLVNNHKVVQCNIRDITERKRAEDVLRESEERWHSLVTASPDYIALHSPEGRYLFLNHYAEGFTEKEVIGTSLYQYLLPESVELFRNHMEKALDTWTPQHFEYDGRGAGGATKTYDEYLVPIHGKNQEIEILAIARDVTERKQAEFKLKEERILLRTLIDNLPDLIYIMDVEGRKIIANQADWQASGKKSMEEVIGKTDLEIYPAELAKDYWALDRSVIDSGEALINREEPGLDARGKPVWLLSSKVPLLDAQGKVVGLVGIGRDITERKHREEEVQSRNAELMALYQFSRQLADANDLAAVIELVNRQAVELVHTTFAGIALLEEADLVPQAVHPVRELGQNFSVGTRRSLDFLPVCRKVLETNEPLSLSADSLELGSVERNLLLLDFARSVCLVPLRVGAPGHGASEAVGLLILGEARADSREPFTPEKLRLARSLGDQAASAIRRMLTREQSERRLQQLASLGEIDRTIASVMDLRVSLQMILRHVCEQLAVDAADVLVFNETLQTLEFSAGRGFLSKAIQGKHQRLGEGLAGKAAIERHLIRIPNLAASQAVLAWPDLWKTELVDSYFAVPLITKGKVKGVLEIYHRSPLNPNEEWLDFLNTLAGQAAIGIENIQLINNLQRSTDELELAYDATIEGWSHALDLRDKETEGHTRRVTDRTVKLARLFGISEKELIQVRWGALLHDIGKMGVPDGILLKPGPLTEEEWVVMKKHPGLAYEMLEPIHYLGKALDIPYCHHEKWDGSGYPRGLKGEQIPLVARIFAVVDVWDALTSNRPYRQAWSEEETRKLIQTGAGTHFDPQVVKTFFLEQG